MTKACVSLCQSASTDINADKVAEFFVEKVEGVRAAASAIALVSAPCYELPATALPEVHVH